MTIETIKRVIRRIKLSCARRDLKKHQFMVNGFLEETRPERNAVRKASNKAYLEDEKAAATLKEML